MPGRVGADFDVGADTFRHGTGGAEWRGLVSSIKAIHVQCTRTKLCLWYEVSMRCYQGALTTDAHLDFSSRLAGRGEHNSVGLAA